MKIKLGLLIFSGDINPIHIDPISARRSITGQRTVHGINSLLWALDSLAKEERITVREIEANFLKPTFLEEEIKCIWNRRKQLITLLSDDIVLTTCRLKISQMRSPLNIRIFSEKRNKKPRELSFIECSELTNQPFKIFGQEKLSNDLFPTFTALYGSIILCEIAAISQIVGMECPGMNSLFASLKLKIVTNKNTIPKFDVITSNERFNFLEISVIGKTLNAKVGAFYRPSPARNLHITELCNHVKENEFNDVHSLIIGGSRGLGELVAKLIAAGGGKPIITYNVGKVEAEMLVDEIHSWGGYCEADSTYSQRINIITIKFTSF